MRKQSHKYGLANGKLINKDSDTKCIALSNQTLLGYQIIHAYIQEKLVECLRKILELTKAYIYI